MESEDSFNMRTRQFPWRIGITRGGALGIWSADCVADEPNVATVASIPGKLDHERADLIVRAVNNQTILSQIEARNLLRGLQVGVSDIDAAVLAEREACAKVAENAPIYHEGYLLSSEPGQLIIARLIRSRSLESPPEVK